MAEKGNMRKYSRLFTSLIVLAVIVFGGASASAQKAVNLRSTPKAFQTFYAKFTRAVERKDKSAVAGLTRFPFKYGWDAGDEGTYTKPQWMKKFKDIFEGTGKLFEQKNPTFYVEGSQYNLTNEADASHYIFKKIGSRYWFTGMIVEP